MHEISITGLYGKDSVRPIQWYGMKKIKDSAKKILHGII